MHPLVGIAKHPYIHTRIGSPRIGLLRASCIYYYEIGDFNECVEALYNSMFAMLFQQLHCKDIKKIETIKILASIFPATALQALQL